jgi:DNA primase
VRGWGRKDKDVDTQHIDLLSLIGSDTQLKKAASTGGGEYHGPCPFCGGTDRFRVWPHQTPPRFWCRQCERSGDAIAYVRYRSDATFPEACRMLGLDLGTYRAITAQPKVSNTSNPGNSPGNLRAGYAALTDAGWQEAAHHFCIAAAQRLQEPSGASAKAYLLGRGLTESVIISTGLGYNPRDQQAHWGNLKVWLAQGIVIPWRIDGRIWRVNIRRPVTGDGKRYVPLSGCANGLYQADEIVPGCSVLITEGEFDALTVTSNISIPNMNLVAVATGSASGARLLRWVVGVDLAKTVLLAFDADKAGDEAADWWNSVLGKKAIRLRPTQHDITDMWRMGEELDAWINSALARP